MIDPQKAMELSETYEKAFGMMQGILNNFKELEQKGIDFSQFSRFLENWVSLNRQLPKETKILKTNDGRNAVAEGLTR